MRRPCRPTAPSRCRPAADDLWTAAGCGPPSAECLGLHLEGLLQQGRRTPPRPAVPEPVRSRSSTRVTRSPSCTSADQGRDADLLPAQGELVVYRTAAAPSPRSGTQLLEGHRRLAELRRADLRLRAAAAAAGELVDGAPAAASQQHLDRPWSPRCAHGGDVVVVVDLRLGARTAAAQDSGVISGLPCRRPARAPSAAAPG